MSAVLLMDLQRDFLDARSGRMPVDERGALAALAAANEVLSKRALAEALPILVLNQFPATARVGNFFRKSAAVAGSTGAQLDGRLEKPGAASHISKSSPSAFSNPELQRHLQAQGVEELYVLGVFAEGCVRSTVLDALELGYRVQVIEDCVASNAAWKKRFAIWSMKRAGARIVPDLRSAGPCAAPAH
jgi:nicotinamidase-related amidase